MEYYIYMTNDCNLNCAYCSVLFDCQKYQIPLVPSYDNSVLIDFIDRTAQQCHDRTVQIIFFGGEPTLEYTRIEDLIAACMDGLSHYDLKFVLHTNGLLLGEITDRILDNLSLIILSVNYEKVPSHHIGQGYFRIILDNVEQIRKRSSAQIMGRLTITEQTSIYTEVMMTQHLFDYLSFQIENTPEFSDYLAFYQTYSFEIRHLFQFWLDILKNGRLLKFIPFMATLDFLVNENYDKEHFCCGYGSHQIYVQTDGMCFACCDSVAEGTHHIGNINEGITFSHSCPSAYDCKDCNYLSLCMGRCGRMHREFTPEHISHYCSMNQSMFDLFIENESVFTTVLAEYPHLKQQLSDWIISITELTP